MENNNAKGWVLVLGFLLIVALLAFGIVWVIRDTVQRTVSPVESMTGDLGTRVSQVLNPSPTVLPDPITIIRDVRSLARLETIQFTVEKVITAEAGQGTFELLFGDKLIFVAHGQVLAGIDMARLGPDDLEIKDGVLYVKLPEPEIFIAALDNEKSYVYDRDTGLLTKGDINLESAARRVAEQEIEKAALEDGVLDLARQNAESYLYRLFRELGYPEVIFVGSPTGTATPNP
ncbi:MAG: DUF4230 domain-containing protein [Anaerolineales bacterium]|nr:DUF4230 domain-containing protein [Anaerolineales bacterium]